MVWEPTFRANILRRHWRSLAILVSLCLIVTAAASTVFLTRSFKGQINDIIASHNISEQALGLLVPLSRLFTSERGYLLTKNEAFLDLCGIAKTKLDESLAKLAEITKVDPNQQARVGQLRSQIGARREAVEAAIKLAGEGRAPEASAALNSAVGQLDEISAAVNGFLVEEDNQLALRNIKMDHLRLWLSVASISSLGGAFVLAFILSTRMSADIRRLVEGQTMLLSENSTLERMVEERTTELEKAMRVAQRERERVETLLQDSDHRIGNSLATVSSLLGIQMRDVSSEVTQKALTAARDRIQLISSAHRRLRLGKDHETVQADEYLPEVIADIHQSNDRNIEIEAHVEPITLSSRDATTLGIIIGELTMNALKHAFPARQTGKIDISLIRDKASIVTLMITDTGVGMARKPHKMRGGGLGTLVVNQLSGQFGGSVTYGSGEEGGTSVVVDFPSLSSASSPSP